MSIETIGEALETAIVWLSRRGGDDDKPLPLIDQLKEVQRLYSAIAALSTIDSDAIRAEKDAKIAELRAERKELRAGQAEIVRLCQELAYSTTDAAADLIRTTGNVARIEQIARAALAKKEE